MKTPGFNAWLQRLWQVVRADVRRFCGRANLLRLAGGLLVGGVLANSPLDADLHAAWQRDLRSPAGDRVFAAAKQCGYARNIVAGSAAAMAVGVLCAGQPACAAAGAWGVQMARAGVVAVPLMGVGQGLLGGNRPSDQKERGSYWRVWTAPHGVHGVSGHALGGALIFLTAAELAPHPAIKAALYACSVMPGLSRINSSSHYPSQVLLGWWLAFLAVRTVRNAHAGSGMRRWIPGLATAAAAIAAAAGLYVWLHSAPPPPDVRVPTPEGSLAEEHAAFALAQATAGHAAASLEGTFRAFPGAAVDPASSSWPGFRGPQRDNVAPAGGPLLESWPSNGPPVLWQLDLGEGHAAAAVHRGRVYLLDYDEKREGDALRCFALGSGRELWQRFYPIRTKRNHGISRTIPAVNDDCIVTLGPQCHVLCVTTTNGAFRWSLNLVERYGTKVPLWWAGQCPLLDGGEAVLAPAGTNALLVGVDAATGKVNWETPNPDRWEMSHASLMVLTADGVRQFVYAAVGGIAGVAADGPARGRLLWRTSAFAPSVVAPSPVMLPDGRFFMTAGYGAGGAMFRISRSNDAWQASLLFRTDRRVFGCEQQTPVCRDGLLFTVLTNDAGDHRQEFACMDLDGHPLWTGGADSRFGLGPFLAVAGDRFFLLDDTGRLSLMSADRSGCRLLARADIMAGRGRDAWGPLALVDGRLLLRDSKRLYCLDVRAR